MNLTNNYEAMQNNKSLLEIWYCTMGRITNRFPSIFRINLQMLPGLTVNTWHIHNKV